ncbi:hypothetical protein AB0D12_34445 [Streptomyces sp. NPDC048479]|uniref:hypothetical protein n=1 Tax=Streptomyces sp. NPDC048479 TaxID=3154725 RepID=UPI00343C5F79
MASRCTTRRWGPDAYEESPDSHWLYRFWDWDKSTEMWDAHTLAYAADMAGLWRGYG